MTWAWILRDCTSVDSIRMQEDGELGTIEQSVIAPVVERLRGEDDRRGPHCAEAAFMTAAREVDLVVAMYHDQGWCR